MRSRRGDWDFTLSTRASNGISNWAVSTVLQSQERVLKRLVSSEGKKEFQGGKTWSKAAFPSLLVLKQDTCLILLMSYSPRTGGQQVASFLSWVVSLVCKLSLRRPLWTVCCLSGHRIWTRPRGKARTASVRWKLTSVYQRVFQNKCKIQRG